MNKLYPTGLDDFKFLVVILREFPFAENFFWKYRDPFPKKRKDMRLSNFNQK
jgi:hypothetical protein